ncbi:hypothetical protein NM688_g7721 [Phlebia brevispora]|uniref:Uncharacterized protein n=1 Tax=Phlebia brevispora TaxID=194682 RepID=A0ACC1S1V5_9APHY|nr:hypothetical protein NM688_g7721 [Phlebia brevispora]
MRDVTDYDLEELEEGESDGEEMDITYRSPIVPNGPGSATPLVRSAAANSQQPKKNHRHTASIASLIRADERAEDGWSPINASFNAPPAPSRTDR